jgi:hypothetical protein
MRGVLVLAANSNVCETVTRCWDAESVYVSHAVRTGTLLTIGKVVIDSVVESQHTCEPLSHGSDVDVAVADRPRPFAIASDLSRKHPQQGRAATARRTEDQHHLARSEKPVDVVKDPLLRWFYPQVTKHGKGSSEDRQRILLVTLPMSSP